MAEIFAIGALLIGLVLIARFNVALLFNSGDLTKVMAALGAMICGAFVGQALFRAAIGETSSLAFSCSPMGSIKFFYNCAGWPVLGLDARDFVEKVFSMTTNMAMITPGFAALVGAIFIQRQLISNLDFDWLDAFKIFLAGFTLMISVLFLPKIAISLSEVLLSAGSYSGLIKEGQENLSRLVELVSFVSTEASRQEDITVFVNLKILMLRMGVFTLSSIINYIGPAFILVQSLIFIGAPVALLSSVLMERDSKEEAFAIGLKYAKFMLVQVVYWSLFTLTPNIENPGSFESLSLGAAGQAFGLATLVIAVSIILLFVSMKYLAMPIFLSTIRRVF